MMADANTLPEAEEDVLQRPQRNVTQAQSWGARA